nr:ZIP family metal transporter [Brevibacillus sp. SYP-B805]
MLHASSLILFGAVLSASGVGGLLICLRRSWSQHALAMMIGAGGGMLFAITVLDLLPHSIGNERGSFVPLILVGFASLLMMELLQGNGMRQGADGLLGVYLGMFTHAFMEGMSLLASYRVDVQLGLSLLLALLVHKVPEGITLASLILAATRSRWLALLGSGSLGLATLFGGVVMLLGAGWLSPRWSHAVLALATGVFLYVSASHLVPFVRSSGRIQAGLCFFAAMLVYLLLSLFGYTGVHSHA